MDMPADEATPTSSPLVHSTLREAVRSPRRRRPTGAPPPLPYRLQTSGVGWLVAAVVLVGLELAVFAHGLRGAAVAVTVVDDAVVRWIGGLAALAASDRVAGRLGVRGPGHRRRGGEDRAAGAAVRGGPADQLGWLG